MGMVLLPVARNVSCLFWSFLSRFVLIRTASGVARLAAGITLWESVLRIRIHSKEKH